MSIPESVQRQGELADEIAKQQQDGTAAAVAEEQAPDGEQAPPPVTNEWEARYNVLQGKYNAEVPRLHGEVSSLRELVTELTKSINNQTAQAQAAPVQETIPESVDYIRKEMPALEDAMKYLINKEVQGLIEEKMKTVDTSINTLYQSNITTAQSMFQKNLSERVPNWEKLNTDPNFLAWLEQPDRYYGQKKLDLLRQASNSLNVNVTANFFEDYIKEKGGSPSTQNKKEKLVAPMANRSSGFVPSTDGVITTKDISKFYEDVSKGYYHGRDDERKKLEDSINAAVASGKVTR